MADDTAAILRGRATGSALDEVRDPLSTINPWSAPSSSDSWRLLPFSRVAMTASMSLGSMAVLTRVATISTAWREGRHLLRTNLIDDDPARLWNL